MKYNLFDYLETSSTKEKDEIQKALKELYINALKDERETFAKARENKKSHIAKASYLESVQRLGAILDVFEVLGIDQFKIQNEIKI